MGKKECYNVMAAYDLTPWSGRDQFAGALEEISSKKHNWRLHTTRPGKFFTKRELVDENGNGFDGFIISMPGSEAVMAEIAKSDIPTVLVNITDRRLAARAKAVTRVTPNRRMIFVKLGNERRAAYFPARISALSLAAISAYPTTLDLVVLSMRINYTKSAHTATN